MTDSVRVITPDSKANLESAEASSLKQLSWLTSESESLNDGGSTCR